MKLKKNWVSVVRGVAFILIAIVFMSVKFYDISLLIVPNGYTEPVYIAWETVGGYFTQVFKVAPTNVILALFFFIIGITEFIEVKK